jgi:hypothetical protein
LFLGFFLSACSDIRRISSFPENNFFAAPFFSFRAPAGGGNQ